MNDREPVREEIIQAARRGERWALLARTEQHDRQRCGCEFCRALQSPVRRLVNRVRFAWSGWFYDRALHR